MNFLRFMTILVAIVGAIGVVLANNPNDGQLIDAGGNSTTIDNGM